jgi:hypothetical protein
MYPNIFSFYLKNIRNLDITDLLKNAGFPEVEILWYTIPGLVLVPQVLVQSQLYEKEI